MASRRGPDNTVRVSIAGLEQAVNMANVFWCQIGVSATPPITDLDAWLNSFANAYKTNFLPRIAAEYSLQQAQAHLFLPGNAAETSLVAITGSGTGGALGSAVQSTSKVISWQISDYYRGGKPRTYLPCCPGAHIVNASDLTSAEITALITAAQAFRTAVNALTQGTITTTQLGTVSFRRGNAEVTPSFKPYTGAKVHPKVGTQRRRLGKWRP
jgi:hypothetical protein